MSERKLSFLIGISLAIMVSGIAVKGAVFNVSDTPAFQAALDSAAANSESDTINVAAGIYSVTVTLTYSSINPGNLDIIGAGPGVTILDGGALVQIMNLESMTVPGDVTLEGLTFQNGTTGLSGGGLMAGTDTAALVVDNCHFLDNSVTTGNSVGGGANLTTVSGGLTVGSSEFRRNSSSGNVGGLFAGSNSGAILIQSNYFLENEVNQVGGSTFFGDGGGAMVYTEADANVTVTGNTFELNIAGGGSNSDGGGLMTYSLGSGGTVTVTSNMFLGNQADLGGGGCIIRINDSGSSNCSGNWFYNNTASDGDGGGVQVYLNQGSLVHTANVFSGNRAGTYGGGAWMYAGSGTVTVTAEEYYDNTADQNGGGLWILSDSANVECRQVVFDSNHAGAVGGGFSFATGNGTAEISQNTFYNNTASAEAGGLYVYVDQNQADVIIRNLISWMDTPESFGYSSGSGSVTLQMTYSDLQGGVAFPWFGTGCIDADPLFVDAAAHDFELEWGSPCIDTGDPASPHDMDGTRADMGAISYYQDIEPVPAMSIVSGILLLMIIGVLMRFVSARSS